MKLNSKESEHFTEDVVVAKILNGEPQLYELLIRRNNPFLYRIGRSYGYNHHDTEDLMQETYINAFKSLSKFENRSQFKTWITRIMLNQCYRKKQTSTYQKESLIENFQNQNTMLSAENYTGRSILNKELGYVLENALNTISEDYRLVFVMRELNGLSIAETSEIMNISETNVKVRLNRAKALLRSEMMKMYSPEDIFEFNLVYCDKIVERVMNKLLNGN